MPEAERPNLTVKLPDNDQFFARTEHSVALIQPGYDPLQKAWREGAQVDRAWMQGSTRAPRVQRIGFFLTSAFLVTVGVTMMPLSGWNLERDGWGSAAITGAIGTVLAMLGARGLWKSLRPARSESHRK